MSKTIYRIEDTESDQVFSLADVERMMELVSARKHDFVVLTIAVYSEDEDGNPVFDGNHFRMDFNDGFGGIIWEEDATDDEIEKMIGEWKASVLTLINEWNALGADDDDDDYDDFYTITVYQPGDDLVPECRALDNSEFKTEIEVLDIAMSHLPLEHPALKDGYLHYGTVEIDIIDGDEEVPIYRVEARANEFDSEVIDYHVEEYESGQVVNRYVR